ncbi:hypothetical protein LJR153_007357 [Paenibacillus sp. LjRoot153]|uniref:hypothetical protein n=1 Tax=Paenibacillus sp. LjRoot153 TaxID=3342270 RepID=UPI003ECE0822
MNTKITYHELSDFNKNIVDEIEKIKGSKEDAMDTFNKYYEVIQAIGEDDAEVPRFYAQKFCKAESEGFTASDWLDHIKQYDYVPDEEDETVSLHELSSPLVTSPKYSIPGLKPRVLTGKIKNLQKYGIFVLVDPEKGIEKTKSKSTILSGEILAE